MRFREKKTKGIIIIREKMADILMGFVSASSNRCSSRSLTNMCSTGAGRDCWRFVILLLLASFHQAYAYVTVSMNSLCRENNFYSMNLSPTSGTNLLLDTPTALDSPCKLEIIAPETHSISMLYTRRKDPIDRKPEEDLFGAERKSAKCMLTVSFPLIRPDDEVKLRWDLCSEEAFSTLERYTEVLPSRVTLEWNPAVRNLDDILASEIVIAALGKGRGICSQPGQLFCSPQVPIYCISKNLVCDGKRNCPEGSDEKELCSSTGSHQKNVLPKSNPETAHIGHDWELLASEVLKKLSSKDGGLHSRKPEVPSSTEKSTVIWADDGSLESEEAESLPDVLKHYGPWGYLMLGMLICGTVLMFCGLWECCCRKPKSPTSAPAGPTLLIINQGAQQGDSETPQTPGPPRYEDLDQPPSYAALFPSSKLSDCQANNILPITIPIVDSLSNLLTGSSQSNQSADNTGHSAMSSTAPNSDVYTIDIRRDLRGSDSNPK